MDILFFGSTSDSVIILESLVKRQTSNDKPFHVTALVTQPPRPVGRKQIITPTPVEIYGKEHNIPVHSFASDPAKAWQYQNESDVSNTLTKLDYDIIISASYGQKIPTAVLKKARFGGLNVHPSLLPKWRGADPVPWAILAGDTFTGVTIVTVEEQFDTGKIIAQQQVELVTTALPDPTRTELFSIGAKLVLDVLRNIDASLANATAQDQKISTYAGRLKRDDGYIPWEIVDTAMQPNCDTTMEQFNNITIVQKLLKYDPDFDPTTPLTVFLDRAIRALSPWPGVWSKVKIKTANGKGKDTQTEEKRIKILSAHLETNLETPAFAEHTPQYAATAGKRLSKLVLDHVQLEGKNPTSYKQFLQAYSWSES